MWFKDLIDKVKNYTNKKIKNNGYINTVAFIALQNRILPNKERLIYFLEKEYDKRIFINNWKEDIGTFDIDDKQVILTLMPHPIDWNELRESYESSYHFEKARDKLKNHKSHLIVSIYGKSNDQLNNNLLLSKIVAALIYSLPALGIYWNNSKVIRGSEEFLNRMSNLNEKKLPIELWIDIRFRINNRLKEDVYTIGMNKLGLKNIEVSSSNLDHYILYILIYELCLKLISQDITLKDGEIFKSSRCVMKVSYTTGTILNNEEVMSLSIM